MATRQQLRVVGTSSPLLGPGKAHLPYSDLRESIYVELFSHGGQLREDRGTGGSLDNATQGRHGEHQYYTWHHEKYQEVVTTTVFTLIDAQ